MRTNKVNMSPRHNESRTRSHEERDYKNNRVQHNSVESFRNENTGQDFGRVKEVKTAKSSMDKYNSYISQAIVELENLYGISEYKHEEISKVFNQVLKDLNKKVGPVKMNLNARASAFIGHIQVIDNILQYYRMHKVEFNSLGNLREICSTLQLFIFDTKDVRGRNKKLNRLLIVLEEVERVNRNFSEKISYRLIRVFCILIMYGNYVDASVLARFILSQINLGIEGGRQQC